MAAPRKPIEQMTPAEHEAAFRQWYVKQNERRILSRAKRSAATSLRNKYQSEYDVLLENAKTQLLARLASGEMSTAEFESDKGEEDETESVPMPEPAATPLPGNAQRPRR